MLLAFGENDVVVKSNEAVAAARRWVLFKVGVLRWIHTLEAFSTSKLVRDEDPVRHLDPEPRDRTAENSRHRLSVCSAE